MATWLQVGRVWLNLDIVVSIELVPSAADPAHENYARVHYVSGKPRDFKDLEDVRILTDFLLKHKAQP